MLMGQSQKLGVLMILSSRGRRGLLATKPTLLKAKSKDLLGGALGGLNTSIHRLFMDGGEFYAVGWIEISSGVLFHRLSALQLWYKHKLYVLYDCQDKFSTE